MDRSVALARDLKNTAVRLVGQKKCIQGDKRRPTDRAWWMISYPWINYESEEYNMAVTAVTLMHGTREPDPNDKAENVFCFFPEHLSIRLAITPTMSVGLDMTGLGYVTTRLVDESAGGEVLGRFTPAGNVRVRDLLRVIKDNNLDCGNDTCKSWSTTVIRAFVKGGMIEGSDHGGGLRQWLLDLVKTSKHSCELDERAPEKLRETRWARKGDGLLVCSVDPAEEDFIKELQAGKGTGQFVSLW